MGKQEEGVSLGDAKARRFTGKAVLVVLYDKDDKELWVPLSQIHDDSELFDEENTEGKLVVNRWFAEKEGLL